jgi:hypothetical protein
MFVEEIDSMNRFKLGLIVAVFMLVGGLALSVSAQDMPTPQVNLASEQLVTGGFVTIDSVYSEGPGFVVIHRQSDGGVAGVSAPLAPGWTNNLRINLNTSLAEAGMSAMLHVDDNTIGTYEFGTVEGADGPVRVGDQIVNPLFSAAVLDATDQKLNGSTVTVRAAAMADGGFVVIHSGAEGRPGPVLGYAAIPAGTSTDVSIELSGDITPIVWPMLHVDDNTIGAYEFGSVEGADAPVRVGGAVATFAIWTVNHIRVNDQIVLYGDNSPMAGAAGEMTPTVRAKSVLSEGPGILVVHADDNGSAGAILGATFVNDGLTENVEVQLDASAGITPVVWPMLHVDAGTVGVYDGLEVDGLASNLAVSDVTFPINIAPALVMSDQALTDGALVITNALMDVPGWIAIHTDNNGQPGPVIATAQLHPGANWNVVIPVDAAAAGGRVFPMLHYDTGEAGTYEFGTVEGADGPVFVAENVVFGPLNITQ